MKLKYNIHHAINFRSYRLGLANDHLYAFKAIQNGVYTVSMEKLIICQHPSNKYGIYYPHVFGKTHSTYPFNI